jgi:hypothetical protein
MYIRHKVAAGAAAALLCLTLSFPSLSVAAGAAEAGFTITEKSLDNLRQEGLPSEILEKLNALQDQKFDTEEEFLKAVRREIGSDRTDRYKEQILTYGADEVEAEIGRILKALKAQKRTIDALLAQNRALEERLAELETARKEAPQKQTQADSSKQKELEQRVKELEDSEIGREDATRAIIRDAMSTVGSKINESVALGGTLEVIGGWSEVAGGPTESFVNLNTAELDLEVAVNEWTLGSLVIEYQDGTDVIFPTTSGFQTGVDRINIDTAFIRIGDPQRFPPYLTAGRIILPFGISTGDPVADVLTIVDPLTIQAFESRNTAIEFGLGFPTPAAAPATAPVTPPPVRPLVINPLITSISSALGYKPRPPEPLTPVTPTPAPPLFNVGIYSYNGTAYEGIDTGRYKPGEHWGATAGFRTKGNCGRSFDQLGGKVFCPWSLDVDIDYNSSIFDSQFLEFEYQDFLGQIGFVPAMAASIKATFGPVSFITEWNGALNRATFTDSIGDPVSIKPSAWQVTLAYQFDWNPWVEAIGAQGNYIAIGYSESRDLAGVIQVVDGELVRVGFVPRRRFNFTVGEWVLSNLRFAIGYSYNVDYPVNQGGTGENASAIFSALTAVW